MIIRSYRNAADFLRVMQAPLEENEVVNSLMLGVALQYARHPERLKDQVYYRSVHDATGLIAAVIHAQNHPLLAYQHRSDSTDAFSMIVADLYQSKIRPTGVNAPIKVAHKFAQLWQVVSGYQPEVHDRQRLYQCTRTTMIDLAEGELRAPHKKELTILIDWALQFSEIVGDALDEKTAEAMLRQRLEDGDLFVWSDGSQPVSMLMKNRAITHTIAISHVFTPVDLRGRGYATAAVHTLTRNLLTAGYHSVNLFTDVTNPTSNHLYQQIGFQPVTEMEKIIFQ
jgi:predicted GNAT family acetyltransferase